MVKSLNLILNFMKIIFTPKCLEYSNAHIESPERVEKAYNILKSRGYEFIEPSPAPINDLLTVHTKEYVERIKMGRFYDPDTPAYEGIFDYACLAVGGAMLAAKENGFSLMRPPGHHAGRNGIALNAPTLGFCYFNNIAIAVKGLRVRTLILDIDCHAPNGTTEIFYESDQVLLLSLHQWPAYPGSGWYTEIGSGKGRGYKINIPLYPNTGDDIYIRTLEEFLPPLVEQFRPKMIAISAGFDAHKSETLTQMNLSANSFYKIGLLLGGITKDIMLVLEGGYSATLPKLVYTLLEGLEGNEIKIMERFTKTPKEIYNLTEKRMQAIKNYLSLYWKF